MLPQTNRVGLADRILAIEESYKSKAAKRTLELIGQGYDVIDLSLEESDFKTPEHICQAAKNAIDEGFHGYSPVAGYPDLRKAIADKLKRENDIDWNPENIVVSTGARHSLANIIQVLVNPGDEVIIFAPYWASYLEMIKLAQGIPVIVNGALNNGFKVTASQLEAAITPKTKMVLYATPSNPSGAVFTEKELREIATIIEKHRQVYVVADEVYEHINFCKTGHFSIGSIAAIKERVITVSGASKGFAMTGWRIGFIATEKWIAEGVEKLQGQVTSGTNSIAQKAATAAFNGPKDSVKQMSKVFEHRRNLVTSLLLDIPRIELQPSQGSFYVFPDVSRYFGKSDGDILIGNVVEFCDWLLNMYFVSVVPGTRFGSATCIRISTTASDERLQKAIVRIKNAVSMLK
jgi:aspartate aminotransferase